MRFWWRKQKPDYAGMPARIRRMELDLGLRDFDRQDENEIAQRLYTQLRYTSPEDVRAYIAEERRRVERSARA